MKCNVEFFARRVLRTRGWTMFFLMTTLNFQNDHIHTIHGFGAIPVFFFFFELGRQATIARKGKREQACSISFPITAHTHTHTCPPRVVWALYGIIILDNRRNKGKFTVRLKKKRKQIIPFPFASLLATFPNRRWSCLDFGTKKKTHSSYVMQQTQAAFL